MKGLGGIETFIRIQKLTFERPPGPCHRFAPTGSVYDPEAEAKPYLSRARVFYKRGQGELQGMTRSGRPEVKSILELGQGPTVPNYRGRLGRKRTGSEGCRRFYALPCAREYGRNPLCVAGCVKMYRRCSSHDSSRAALQSRNFYGSSSARLRHRKSACSTNGCAYICFLFCLGHRTSFSLPLLSIKQN
jgi:hypothetical protein